MVLSSLSTQAPLVSLWVVLIVPLLQVSAPVGAPVAAALVSPGHSTVALAGKLTKVGAVVSFTVMVWCWAEHLPQLSLPTQRLCMVLIERSTQAPLLSLSVELIVP